MSMVSIFDMTVGFIGLFQLGSTTSDNNLLVVHPTETHFNGRFPSKPGLACWLTELRSIVAKFYRPDALLHLLRLLNGNKGRYFLFALRHPCQRV